MNQLTIENISKSFGSINAIQDISFKIEKGEKIGIVGPSGSGKSVLLKVLAGIYQPDYGNIEWSKSRPATGFLFQEGALFDSMSILENVMFPLISARRYSTFVNEEYSYEEARKLAVEMLGFVGLIEAIDKYPSELSGGMRKRAAIARALVHSPSFLFLDDPTSGLDPITANTILNLLERLTNNKECTMIIVSHDLRRLIPRIERVVMLYEGSVLADCKVEDIKLNAPQKMISFLETRYDFSNE